MQLPPQHWVLAKHASPPCLQNDVSVLHLPPMQPFEQHSPSPAQARQVCVAVLQMGVDPPHCAFDVHGTQVAAGG